MNDIVICCLAKHENDYINDWVNWHLKLGFDHIYIYDNNPVDYEPIESRIEQLDKVTIYKIPDRITENIQKYYYDQFYHTHEFNWCAFIDCDEYIVLNKWKTVNDMLSDDMFEGHDCIRFNMRLFGDNDLIERDMSKPVYEVFTKWNDCRDSHGGKHILRGNLEEIKIESAHYPFQNDYTILNQITPDGHVGVWQKNDLPYSDNAYLNHYKTKSLSEFVKQKLDRGDAVWPTWNPTMEYYWKVNQHTEEKDRWLKERGYIND